jgi:hypothetical protein
MDCSTLLRILYLCGRLPGLALLGFTIVATAVPATAAQPVAAGPDEVSRLRQLTTLTPDWSGTDLYDLARPVELVVTVEGLLVAQEGGTELLFSTAVRDAQFLTRFPAQGPVYHATLQLTSEIKRLGLDLRKLKTGKQALIRGWPATRNNHSPSVVLVDEIDIRGGAHIALHDYPAMKLKKKATGN